MKIQNFDALTTTPLRKDALQIAEAGLVAIDTKTAISEGVRIEGDTLFVRDQQFLLNDVAGIYVAAIGKCAMAASEELERVLGDRLTGGVAIDIRILPDLAKIKAFKGTHPLPSAANIEATAALVAMLKDRTEKDLVIFIISGGGSTLLSMPQTVGFEDEAKIVKALFKAGATIEELNTIRKHLSLARGGYLAEYARKAKSVALIFSDVLGNDIEFISSGPTVKDDTTVADAEAVMAKYDVLAACGIKECHFIETPKDGDIWKNMTNMLFVSNETALEVMRKKAIELGYSARVCDTSLSGEASKVGVRVAKEIGEAYAKTAMLYGGETTVTINGDGVGGRNQELAVAALAAIHDGELVVSFGSDGHDNTDAAGGIADAVTKAKAAELKLSAEDSLSRNDSYNFLKAAEAQIMTGDTGSNVSDLLIALKE